MHQVTSYLETCGRQHVIGILIHIITGEGKPEETAGDHSGGNGEKVSENGH